MKILLQTILFLFVSAAFAADDLTTDAPKTRSLESASSENDIMDAQPKLLRITATIDGSGRIIFTRDGVRYEHKHWDRPENVVFDGEPWPNLSRTPAAWAEVARHLDLSKAWIVKRKGRDVIALEHTPVGFDLYLCDSPNGAAEYEVLLAIPRVK